MSIPHNSPRILNDSRLLTIGGTGRNVGKTEFICRLIARIAENHPVAALKVSAVFPDEAIFHGSHPENEPEHMLFEETRPDTAKDTSRMLRAGASPVFYLRGDDSTIGSGYARFRRKLSPDTAIVCESNSLAQFVRPGLQIMITAPDSQVKERALPQLASADIVIVSDRYSGFREIERITYSRQNHWRLKER